MRSSRVNNVDKNNYFNDLHVHVTNSLLWTFGYLQGFTILNNIVYIYIYIYTYTYTYIYLYLYIFIFIYKYINIYIYVYIYIDTHINIHKALFIIYIILMDNILSINILHLHYFKYINCI